MERNIKAVYTSYATKKLVMKSFMENKNIRKRTIYFQELNSIGKMNVVSKQALNLFFDTKIIGNTEGGFSKN